METFQRILLAFITFFISIFFLGIIDVNAAKFSGLETKIIAESSTAKIIKLQNFLQKLDLYNGKIDGKYYTVLPYLLDYQKKSGLIKNNSDWGAGYFGIQTLTAIQGDYPNKFDEYKYILEQDKPAEGERYFVVTAYYSALPNQRRYSYSSSLRRYRTYAEAIRMQGKGTNGASGKKVFPGMLAGPRNYDFGTKIELDGIGVGSVQDRGSAIVNAGERKFVNDRIDIWMGYGDEGRVRAEKWGARKIKGKIVSNEVSVSVVFNKSVVSSNLRLYVTPVSNSVDIKKLQSLFSELNLYDGGIDGKYISIKENLIDFQLKHKIITSKYSEQAGYFGKKTIAVLQSEYKINDSIFHEPIKVAYEEFTGLTRKDKFALIRVRNKIVSFMDKKSNGNKLKIIAQKTDLQRRIDKIIKKSKNKNQIKKLKYLKIIL